MDRWMDGNLNKSSPCHNILLKAALVVTVMEDGITASGSTACPSTDRKQVKAIGASPFIPIREKETLLSACNIA